PFGVIAPYPPNLQLRETIPDHIHSLLRLRPRDFLRHSCGPVPRLPLTLRHHTGYVSNNGILGAPSRRGERRVRMKEMVMHLSTDTTSPHTRTLSLVRARSRQAGSCSRACGLTAFVFV
ncbi:unnamed protein product, partial [Ectocarpus sp. 12 AP-2014]